jgi:IS30 family transposase
MATKGYHHMTLDQRCQIQTLQSTGKSQNSIARELGVSKSTISREIARNSSSKWYIFTEAERRSAERRSSASKIPKKMKGELKALVLRRLALDWSPEQISGRLKNEGISISFVTIYKYVREDRSAGGSLYQHLRHGGKKYRSKKSRQAGVHCIPNRVGIEERPAEVESKLSVGHWEGDTVISHRSRCALLTLVERKSKFLRMK